MRKSPQCDGDEVIDYNTEYSTSLNKPRSPTGSKPVTRTFEYDDLYRLLAVGYNSGPGRGDVFVPPLAPEGQNGDPWDAIRGFHLALDASICSA